MTETHQVGIALVMVSFIVWAVCWIALAVYGLVWLWRDRARASLSIGMALVVFAAGAAALLEFAPGSNL